MRIGHGYDVHRLVTGRKLILGGVEIPHYFGLLGHSDADVLTHAVMDALLGAAGLGDIGTLFPDSDISFEGASSILLLSKVTDMIQHAGYGVVNIDATILAQKPKISPYIPQMRRQLSRCIGVPSECIGIKATTEEGLGLTGREEGIAAHAVCLLEALSPDRSAH